MAATVKSSDLDKMAAGMTLEEAQERLDEALSGGEIVTKGGRVTTGEMGYYALRLFATGSHQYEGNEVPQDLRAAAWKVYKETSPPESAQRRNKELSDGETARVTVRRSKGLTVPFGADPQEMKATAARMIDEWFAGEGARIAEENEARAKKAIDTAMSLGISKEQLVGMLKAAGVDLADLAKVK